MNSAPLKVLERDLAAGRTAIIDGATGTELERRGVPMHEDAWCAMATLTHPEILRSIHLDYIRAGARLITANTFSTNRNMLAPAGLDHYLEKLNRRAVAIALEARAAADARDRVVVAGSMSHQMPLLPGADQRDRDFLPSTKVASANFRELARLLADCGVDLILMEMMSDPALANPAIQAALATGLPVWVGFSARHGGNGEPVSYARPELTAEEMLDAIPVTGAGVVGIMHSNVELIGPMLELLKQRWSGLMMAYPDSGYFRMPHWQFVDIVSPAELVSRARDWVSDGVQLLGGCCGLGVEHIQALSTLPDCHR